MTRVVLEPEAEQDITEAYDWYERQRVGLGERFLTSLAEALDRIAEGPQAYPVVERGVRRALLVGRAVAAFLLEVKAIRGLGNAPPAKRESMASRRAGRSGARSAAVLCRRRVRPGVQGDPVFRI